MDALTWEFIKLARSFLGKRHIYERPKKLPKEINVIDPKKYEAWLKKEAAKTNNITKYTTPTRLKQKNNSDENSQNTSCNISHLNDPT